MTSVMCSIQKIMETLRIGLKGGNLKYRHPSRILFEKFSILGQNWA